MTLSHFLPWSESISSAICVASSLVGAKIIACTFPPGVSFSIKGIPKAAVLPVPVAACPMMFFSPLSKSGITCAWIGEGVTNHFLVIAARVCSQIQRSLNWVIVFFLQIIKKCSRYFLHVHIAIQA